MVLGKGISPKQSLLQAIESLFIPTDKDQFRSNLGLYEFYSRFGNGFSQIALPLRQLLKKSIINSTPLFPFHHKLHCVIYVDASAERPGAMLNQKGHIGEKMWLLLPVAESRFSTIE